MLNLVYVARGEKKEGRMGKVFNLMKRRKGMNFAFDRFKSKDFDIQKLSLKFR